LPAHAQDDTAATVTRPLTKLDGWLDWRTSASALERRVRAMWPWPRAWTTFGSDTLQVLRAEALTASSAHPPGTVFVESGTVSIACGEGVLRLAVVQPAGRPQMAGEDWIAGRRPWVGLRLGDDRPIERPPLVRAVGA
jgi:methionyl-tRNA formyltransferase